MWVRLHGSVISDLSEQLCCGSGIEFNVTSRSVCPTFMLGNIEILSGLACAGSVNEGTLALDTPQHSLSPLPPCGLSRLEGATDTRSNAWSRRAVSWGRIVIVEPIATPMLEILLRMKKILSGKSSSSHKVTANRVIPHQIIIF